MNRSRRSLKKSNHEQIDLVILYKRVTKANCSRRSLSKSDVSDSLFFFRANDNFALFTLKNEQFATKFFLFFTIFYSFSLLFLFLCPINSKSLLSLLALLLFFKEQHDRFAPVALYNRATESDSLPSLFTTEQLWVIRSRRSLQQSNCEWFAPVALYNRATMRDSLPLLFTTEQPWVIFSCCSLQQSDCEWFTPVALYNRATMSDSSRCSL